MLKLFAIWLICGLAKADDIKKEILDALNGLKDTAINPAIHAAVPNPINLNVNKGGSTSTCILKLFGHCTCHATAKYDVSLKDIAGLNGLSIANFDSLDADIDVVHGFKASIGISVAEVDLSIEHGGASAEACACHICPKAHGSASTRARVRLSLSAGVQANINAGKKCIDLSVASVNVNIQELNIHDTHISINVGPVPGVDIGKLADLVNDLIPQIRDKIKSVASKAVSDAVPKAINGKIPCIPIPSDETANATLVV